MIQQFIFLFYVVILGLNFFLLVKKELNQVYLFILAFPVGFSLWCLVNLLILIAGIPSTKMIVLNFNLLLLILLIVINLKRKNYSGQNIRTFVIFLFIFSIISGIFLKLNFSYLSNDSWLLIIGGNTLGSSGQIPDVLLAIKGIYTYLMCSPGSYFGFDYPYAVFPLLMISLFLLFFYGIYSVNDEKKIKIDYKFYFCSIALIFLLSSYFVLFSMFYIISNVLTAVFSLFALYGIYKRLQSGSAVWTIFLILMIINIALLRLEGSLFFLIPVVIFLSREEIPSKEKMLFAMTGIGIPILWFLRLSFSLSDFIPRRMKVAYSLQILSLLLLTYIFILLYVLISQKGILSRLNPYLPLLFLLSLSFAWTYMILTRGLEIKGAVLMIIKRYGVLIINVLKDGKWGITWIALFVLFVLALFLKRIKYESVFIYYIFSFFLLYNVINIYRYGWRSGWGDSGNRILLHIIFIVAFYVFMKIGRVIFPDRNVDVLDEE